MRAQNMIGTTTSSSETTSSKKTGRGKAKPPVDTAVRDALKAQAQPAYDAVCLAWATLNRQRSIVNAEAYAAAVKSVGILADSFASADKADPSAQIMQSRTITVDTAVGRTKGAFDSLLVRWIGGGATVSQFRSGSMKAARDRVR